MHRMYAIREIRLTISEAISAASIQRAIDSLDGIGGRLVLPRLELELDRGLELRSGVELVGQGEGTILRQAPGRIYPLMGYHNYGMWDVPLQHTAGLEPGMTVAVRDNLRGGFYETFARITWIDDNWVGLDRGLEADLVAEQDPVLVTSYPLIFGRGVSDVAVRNLTLDGARGQQPAGIGACRGAALYLYQSHRCRISEVVEQDFSGEGLGFQMCSHVEVSDCSFSGNQGNGYHPGAGSTSARFERCVAMHNDRAGFFFCVRANHISVADCDFTGNRASGISVGTRDCHNLIERCQVRDNDGPGILFRQAPRPVEVHSCHIAQCEITGNARTDGRAQIEILGDAHDLALTGSVIRGPADCETAGVYLAPSVQQVWLEGNRIKGCFLEIMGDRSSLARAPISVSCGADSAEAQHFRHLGA